MSSDDATSGSVTSKLTAETQRKRRLIRDSLWPQARLFAEILYNQIDRDNTFNQAAALTYKTLFSLLPIFVLTLLFLSSISAGGGRNALDSTVERIMFEQLSLDKLQMTDDKGHGMVNDKGEPIMLSNFVEPLIERAKRSVNARATGLIAFGILFYGAVSLMLVIEGAFNQIYGVVQPRSWTRRITLYWCVLTLGPLGAAASIVLGNEAYVKATNYVGTGPISWALTPLQVISGIVVSFILVVVLYLLVPGTRVKWKSALLGGAVGAVLWELCKWGFGMYVHWSMRGGRGANSYGSLALLPLFMLWIYLTWSSILIGLHVAYMHQYYPLLKRQYFFTRMGRAALSDLRWVLPLGVLVYRRFREGKATYVHDAAETLMLPTDAATQLLESLQDAGLVHGTRGAGFALARPPEKITAYDLLMAVRPLAQVPPQVAGTQPSAAERYPAIKAMEELEKLETGWARAHTLTMLAAG